MSEHLTGAGTANDRFKRSYSNLAWMGILAATVAHFCLFFFFPNLEAADLSTVGDELEAIELPPEVKIPPPPEQIARPATPKVALTQIDEDITIAPTTFEDNPVENLPPPPPGANPSDRPSFIPFDVKPELKNRRDVAGLLVRRYPRMLKDAGIGGTVILWVYIDEEGVVQKSQVNKTSGYPAMDKAAQDVAGEMRFSPAFNRDKKTPVWISIPIEFKPSS